MSGMENSNRSSETDIRDIPDEVLSSIFVAGPLSSIASIARTCKHWNTIVSENNLWREQFMIRVNTDVSEYGPETDFRLLLKSVLSVTSLQYCSKDHPTRTYGQVHSGRGCAQVHICQPNRMLTTGKDSTVKVFDMKQQTESAISSCKSIGKEPFYTLCYSPNSHLTCAAGDSGQILVSKVNLQCDATDALTAVVNTKAVLRTGTASTSMGSCFTDSDALYIGDYGFNLYQFDVETQSVVQETQIDALLSNRCSDVAYVPSRNVLATGGWKDAALLVDPRTLSTTTTMHSKGHLFSRVCVDGDLLLMGCQGGELVQFDLRQPSQYVRESKRLCTGWIMYMQYVAGHVLAAGDGDALTCVDWNDLHEEFTASIFQTRLRSCHFNMQYGLFAACGWNDNVLVYDVGRIATAQS